MDILKTFSNQYYFDTVLQEAAEQNFTHKLGALSV